MPASDPAAGPVRLILGHPPGLFVLVGLKVWEVFSYAGMRAFLVLYMIAAFDFADARAALVFGSYGALVLATSVIGGFVADRLIGARRAIQTGATIIMAGHLGLAGEALLAPGPYKIQLFFASLAAIAAGTGLLKPSVLTLIGRLYDDLGPRRRETGFYAYYLGINLGGFLAPLLCGWLAIAWGWQWGFAAAAAGMAAGLLLFVTQQRYVVGAGEQPEAPLRVAGLGPGSITAFAVATMVGGAWLLVQRGVALGIVLALAALAGAIYIGRAAATLPAAERRKLVALFALLPSVLMYVMFYEQIGTSVTLFVDRLVDRRVGSLKVATAQVVALNSLLVIILVPLLAAGWQWLETRRGAVLPPAKFAIGFLLIAGCFAVLATAAGAASASPLSLGWIVVAYLLLTLGELCIAPIAYATTGTLAPPRLAGVAMGMTLLAFAIGNFVAGLVAGAADIGGRVEGSGGAVYAPFFWQLAALSLGWAVLLAAGSRWIARRMA